MCLRQSSPEACIRRNRPSDRPRERPEGAPIGCRRWSERPLGFSVRRLVDRCRRPHRRLTNTEPARQTRRRRRHHEAGNSRSRLLHHWLSRGIRHRRLRLADPDDQVVSIEGCEINCEGVLLHPVGSFSGLTGFQSCRRRWWRGGQCGCARPMFGVSEGSLEGGFRRAMDPVQESPPSVVVSR